MTHSSRAPTLWPARAFAVLIGVMSLAMAYGAVLLVQAGGSPVYLGLSTLLAITAICLWRANLWTYWSFALLLLSSLIWTYAEAGLNIWAMLPRLALFYLLALLLLLPPVRRALTGGPRITARIRTILASALVVAMIALPLSAIAVQMREPQTATFPQSIFSPTSGAQKEWTAFGGTNSGLRFSTLDQITPDNVHNLKVAWTFSFGDKKHGGLQLTPLMVNNRIYACNGVNVIVALDPETGKMLWRHDPKVTTDSPFLSCRGVAYYEAPHAQGLCAKRIIATTVDTRIIALDADTGARCPGFGINGEISARDGMGDILAGYYSFTAAPTIARDKIIVGGTVVDNQYWGEPSGVIRAFDVMTGKLAWAYDAGRPDRKGLPPQGESYTRSTPNAWAQMAYDDALGLVYVPTGNATPDYYGAQRRPFDDEISSAVVALDAQTGARRWVFQTTHHDLWDYDIGSQPLLFDLPTAQGLVPVLAQPTKRGEIFLINRRTGAPLAPLDNRIVPTRGHAPGERLSPTQPFPTDMPSLGGGLLHENMMWGLTPFDQLYCRIQFKRARYDGPFTPPGLTDSITYPGFLGGMDWGSASLDPERGVMVAVTGHLANHLKLITRKEAQALGAYPMGKGREGLQALRGYNAMEGTPYAETTAPFLSPLKMPCQQPPFSRISAIDMRTRSVLWSEPLGMGREAGPLGMRGRLPFTMGVPALGGVLMTRSGLIFVGAAVDRAFRAIDVRTGKILWQVDIPESAHATAMSYSAPRSGRQIILVAGAGHRSLSLGSGDTLFAYALK